MLSRAVFGLDVKAVITASALFFCGLFTGYSVSSVIAAQIMEASLSDDIRTADYISKRAPSFANAGRGIKGGAEAFEKANPFRADRKSKAQGTKAGQNTGAVQVRTNYTLKGTLPDIGAWIELSGNTRLVLKGQKIGDFTLTDIKYYEATLTAGDKEHVLPLILSGGNRTAVKPKRTITVSRTPRRPVKQVREEISFEGLEPASESQEGAVPRELVDALLMNPYEELAKVRMLPTENGMQLARLSENSILAKVGVAQGDVVSAVNGVQIMNVGDAANALNSMMNGTRFDVTVIRDGKPLELRYQVK